jgi:hypothetical protein
MNESSKSSYDFSFHAPQVQDHPDVLDEIEERASELNLVGFITWDIGAAHYGHVKGSEDDIQIFFEKLKKTVPDIAIHFDDFQAEEKERDHQYEEFSTRHTYPSELERNLSQQERNELSMDEKFSPNE